MTHRNSVFDRISDLRVGEACWIEAESPRQCVTIQRTASTESRYPEAMRGWKFSTRSFIAVHSSSEPTHYLIRVRREE